MSFKLYAPGERKGNKDFLARIVVDGQRYEKVLTGCKTQSQAHVRAMELELELRADKVPGAKEDITFRQAAQLYAASRDPVLDLDNLEANYDVNARTQARFIAQLLLPDIGIGGKFVRTINHADIVAAANKLHGGKMAATKNRSVIRPAAAILHYASKNGYCPWLRIEAFSEPAAKTRAVAFDTVPVIINAAETAMQRLLLLWLFRQGTRISQTLSITWGDIDLQQQTFTFYNKKAEREHTMPLHPEVFEALAAIPGERTGQLWPWTVKSGVYKWLQPLVRGLGVRFTPHMARHTVGKGLNGAGAGLRTIMDALGHLDPKSSIRYQSSDIETVRAALTAVRKTG